MLELLNHQENESITRCETPVALSQSFSISGCTDVTIDNINFTQSGEIGTDCQQEILSSTETDTQISQIFTQQAEAISQAFSLGGGSEAENITKLMQQLNTDIQNSYKEECLNPVIENQTFDIPCNSDLGGTVKIGSVNFDQTIKAMTKCTQETRSVTQTKTKIENIIDQKSKAVIEPLFGGIILIIVIIIIIFFVMRGSGGSSSWITIIVVIAILIGGYLLVAWFSGWWPFILKDDPKT